MALKLLRQSLAMAYFDMPKLAENNAEWTKKHTIKALQDLGIPDNLGEEVFKKVDEQEPGLRFKVSLNSALLAFGTDVHSIAFLFAFLGFPPQNPVGKSAYAYFIQFLKEFAGWPLQPKAPLWQKIISPIFLIWNLLSFAPKLAINILKLATEVLPLFVATQLGELIDLLKPYTEKSKPLWQKILAWVAMITVALVKGVFEFVYGLGRALTSPIKSVQLLWKMGEKIFAVLSAICSVIYLGLVLIPAAFIFAPVLIAQGLPYLPQFMQTALLGIASVFKAVASSSIFSPFFSAVGAWMGSSLASYGISVAGFELAEVGLSTLISFVGTIIGTVCTVMSDKFLNWYRSFKEPVKKEPVVSGLDDDQDNNEDVNPDFGSTVRMGARMGNRRPYTGPIVEEVSDSESEDFLNQDQPQPPVVDAAARSACCWTRKLWCASRLWWN